MALVPILNVANINDLCSRMAVDDPEEGGAVFDEEYVPDEVDDLRWCLVGRFMIDKSLHFQSMKNTLAAL